MSFTDEELAEVVRAIHFYCGTLTNKSDRLIAALKAERAEVERLKKIINEYRSRTISYRVDL